MRKVIQILMPLCIAIFLAFPAHACLWDRNTIEQETKDKPDILRAITGRFERNPPLFYQMRIDREQKELARNRNLYNDYDDISVAYDRLGDDDRAIMWIERKRARLPKYNPNNTEIKEQWYRYWANYGTFLVHRWLRHGSDRTKIAEVIKSKQCIANAIQINPAAHFHREKYQLSMEN